jgi:hypothetical protein
MVQRVLIKLSLIRTAKHQYLCRAMLLLRDLRQSPLPLLRKSQALPLRKQLLFFHQDSTNLRQCKQTL